MAASSEAVARTEIAPLTPNEKVKLLRRYEDYCYQIAYYLLNDGQQARQAAEQALLALYKQEEWYEMAHAAQKAKVKRLALHKALELRKIIPTVYRGRFDHSGE
ncbi:hypothetical protein [Paenibacillus piri]|uniref:Uncharacterized protein n=1 Tax=Paenibacillus piri TaxID=2547395 RepID=A0A4R5KBE8_9BACL|nr:hypothetical protein [Paenibacillus piri]TDF91848.1 hypothetical protein E1757_31395 [Paenibacillus piri]